uniref:Uncharacterized protein n=1 Tax=Knipowitschia caucasica TaxID=637954 RepID=A0AAV2J4G9_KNICA
MLLHHLLLCSGVCVTLLWIYIPAAFFHNENHGSLTGLCCTFSLTSYKYARSGLGLEPGILQAAQRDGGETWTRSGGSKDNTSGEDKISLPLDLLPPHYNPHSDSI